MIAWTPLIGETGKRDDLREIDDRVQTAGSSMIPIMMDRSAEVGGTADLSKTDDRVQTAGNHRSNRNAVSLALRRRLVDGSSPDEDQVM